MTQATATIGRAELLNRETHLGSLAEALTPAADFYRRSNFPIPRLDAGSWRLPITGEVERPLTVSGADLRSYPQVTMAVTLECAGNGRNLMRPIPPGTPWGLGAASTAEFTGIRLRDLLDAVRPSPRAVDVLFEGADRGSVGTHAEVPFARSLPLAVARGENVMLAWAMNGEPLPVEHGYPLRLLVAGWYGMASVKWLAAVRLLDEPFHGPFQGELYVYRDERGTPDGTPVTRVRVRSVIAAPAEGAEVALGPVEIRGTAWSGSAPVARVEVSTDAGASWSPATLGPPLSPYGASPWRATWLPPRRGEHLLLARATDGAGNVQPEAPVWNALGYGNNAVHGVRVRVV